MGDNTRRINVIFPEQLLAELDALVPSGKRSEVIVEATADFLARMKVLSALQESAGAWEDEAHPELSTSEDVNRWLEQLRASWRRVPLLTEEHGG